MSLPRLTVAAMFGYQILRPWRSYMIRNKYAIKKEHTCYKCLKISVDRAREDIISTLFNWINWFLEV
ncbi:hypothetical protein HanLR1_Chr17g0685591 [Helianthus annuus]|nr:hypothetical protein HanHA89_Chr17g0727631 [Helianthus annuus]KAJ0634211.1 hypothetical protein HanLR1_Chr17g0685591 [Helianthus annuus]